MRVRIIPSYVVRQVGNVTSSAEERTLQAPFWPSKSRLIELYKEL